MKVVTRGTELCSDELDLALLLFSHAFFSVYRGPGLRYWAGFASTGSVLCLVVNNNVIGTNCLTMAELKTFSMLST